MVIALMVLGVVWPVLFPSQQFRIGRIQFAGNEDVDELVIRRMIPLEEGDIFNQALWEQGIEQINRSGLFEPVSPDDAVLTLDHKLGIVDIELRLTERDHQRIDVNAGGGTTGGTSIGLDYSNINLTGRADRFIGRLRIGSRERSVAAAYSIYPLTRTPFIFEASGYYQRLELVDANVIEEEREPLFVERTAGARLGLSFPLARSAYPFAAATTATVVYSFSSTNLSDTVATNGSGVSQLEQGGIRLASLTPMIAYNTLDRDFDPRRGQQLLASIEVGARALGGSLNTVMPYFDYRRFFAPGPREPAAASREPRVIGFRFRASHIAAFGSRFRPEALSVVDGVPVFRRLFLGGENEVRGYDVRSISPLARIDRLLIVEGQDPVLITSELRPVGADTKLVFNAEYRIPLVWRLSAAVFFDIGAAFNDRGLDEERFESVVGIEPTGMPATIATVVRPLTDGEDALPGYRVSLGAELRFPIPLINLPLRLIFAANPNAQRQPPGAVFIAPEKRFAFRFGFSRTL
ncbi:MAG TPA: BamA/TamA family outer membrane protein [Blastocatellia bacterium]|nr:BamA/TamA family outer membrane protein [Blastocatellia bacterium]